MGPLLPLELENGPVDDESEGESGGEEEKKRVTLEEAATKLAQELHSSTADLMQVQAPFHTMLPVGPVPSPFH